jgi:hypothetical protein
VSIVRVGLAEAKGFAEGYDAIFGKKKDKDEARTEEAQAKPEQTEQKAEEKKEGCGRPR